MENGELGKEEGMAVFIQEDVLLRKVFLAVWQVEPHTSTTSGVYQVFRVIHLPFSFLKNFIINLVMLIWFPK